MTTKSPSPAQVRTRKLNYLKYLNEGSSARRQKHLLLDAMKSFPSQVAYQEIFTELLYVSSRMRDTLEEEKEILLRLSELSKGLTKQEKETL